VYLLDNPKHDERGGVEVFVPFESQGGQPLLLVDLGFLPGNGTASGAAVAAAANGGGHSAGAVRAAAAARFRDGWRCAGAADPLAEEQHLSGSAQSAMISAARLYPRVLALDADPASIYVRVHTLDFSSMPPARHRAYAFQWFSFAIAAVVILLVLNRKTRENHESRISPGPCRMKPDEIR
jgi:surfeit locus 1 family protein